MSKALLCAAVCAAVLSAACKPGPPEIVDRTVKVGCGMCRFGVVQAGGCYWAADFDGKITPVRGDVLPKDHADHAPDGMCNVTREAVVSGTLYETYFLATHFDLGPVAPAAAPRFSPDDRH